MASFAVARVIVPIAALLSFAGGSRADNLTIDLSPYVNSDLTTYTDGFNYPQHGGPITVDGIPFLLATVGPNEDTGIIQTSASSVDSYDIPIDVFGVGSAYVLMNSAWGACGANVGEIDFVGSAGTYVYSLTEGVNVRDHFAGSFCNTASGMTGSASFGPDRLDMYKIALPSDFSGETLESIDFVGYGTGQQGAPFLAGLTVDPPPSAVPEPSALATLLIAGVSLIVMSRFRKRTPLMPFRSLFEGISYGDHDGLRERPAADLESER